MNTRILPAVAISAWLAGAGLSAQRPAAGVPDFQGLWTNGTATPLQRPQNLADKPFFTRVEAATFESTAVERLVAAMPPEDKLFASDVSEEFLETQTLKVLDDLRTSLVVDPANGRIPAQLDAARERAAARPKRNFDDVETMRLDERCLMSTAQGSSNAVPPMVPNPFAGNFYQFVQTRDYLLIYTEWIHDARIIRIGGTHRPPEIRSWLGDSIGRWEGETLVVDTTNFRPETRFQGSGERLHVVERFSRADAGTLRYRATIEDPDTWATPWTVDIPFKTTPQPIYELACHEGNYAIENFMRGARAEERRAVAK